MTDSELNTLRELLMKAVNKLDHENKWGKVAHSLQSSLGMISEKSVAATLRKD